MEEGGWGCCPSGPLSASVSINYSKKAYFSASPGQERQKNSQTKVPNKRGAVPFPPIRSLCIQRFVPTVTRLCPNTGSSTRSHPDIHTQERREGGYREQRLQVSITGEGTVFLSLKCFFEQKNKHIKGKKKKQQQQSEDTEKA